MCDETGPVESVEYDASILASEPRSAIPSNDQPWVEPSLASIQCAEHTSSTIIHCQINHQLPIKMSLDFPRFHCMQGS